MSEETKSKKCCLLVTQEVVIKGSVYYLKCPECKREVKEVREEVTSDHLPLPTIS